MCFKPGWMAKANKALARPCSWGANQKHCQSLRELEQLGGPQPSSSEGVALPRSFCHFREVAPVTRITDTSAIPQAVRRDPCSLGSIHGKVWPDDNP